MSALRAGLTVSSILLATIAIAGCRIGEVTHETEFEPLSTPSKIVTCTGPFVNPDLSTLEPCGNGQGHCYEQSKTAVGDTPPCSGTKICVPDKILTANGAPQKSCAFFIGGKPGVCTSLLISDINDHKNELQPDVCDAATERCAPCVNPTDGTDSGLCGPTGVYQNDCTGGAGSQQTCCHGAGICMKPDGVPEDQRGELGQDVCPAAKVCGPASLINGHPKKCHALGLSGVCLDICFSQMLGSAHPVLGGDCQPTEVCLPCVVGAGEGVPGCD